MDNDEDGQPPMARGVTIWARMIGGLRNLLIRIITAILRCIQPEANGQPPVEAIEQIELERDVTIWDILRGLRNLPISIFMAILIRFQPESNGQPPIEAIEQIELERDVTIWDISRGLLNPLIRISMAIMRRIQPEANGQPPMIDIEMARDGVPLYRATMTGDWEEARALIEEREDIVRIEITNKKETALHVAVAANHKEFVQNLLETMEDADLILKNDDGNTAFCFAAAAGAIEIAEMLINRNNNLPMERGGGGMTPIRMAAVFGQAKMVRYLYRYTIFGELDDNELRSLFLAIVSADIYDIALEMLEENIISIELALNLNGGEETALRVMASKPFAISHNKQLNWFQNLANSVYEGFFHEAKMRTVANRLVEKLCESALQLPIEQFPKLLESHLDLLFDAAQLGNFELLVILIRSYPDLIWRVNDKNQTIFHIAASNRHEDIFNLIYEIGNIKDFLALHKENEWNDSLLHLVARMPPSGRLQTGSGPAFQMQREILWFKAVEEVVTPSYIKDKNIKEELVAHELFTKEHEDLRTKGEQWMRHTATSCMVVATLIATVVFAAAFALPGGNDDKGFPRFRKKLWFDFFVTSNSVALFSSVISIVIFLLILASRYAVDDFLTSLPTKLMLGSMALIVSIFSMVTSFATALISMRHKERTWTLVLIIVLYCLTPVAIVVLYVKLWLDRFHSCWVNAVFRRQKNGLYS